MLMRYYNALEKKNREVDRNVVYMKQDMFGLLKYSVALERE